MQRERLLAHRAWATSQGISIHSKMCDQRKRPRRHQCQPQGSKISYSCCSVAQPCLTLATPWTAPHQASLSFTISWSLLKLMSTESVMPSNHLVLCCPLLPLPSTFPSIRVFFNESVLRISTLLPMKTAKNAEGKTQTEEAQSLNLTWESW